MTTMTAAAKSAKSTIPAAAEIEPSESRIDRDSHFNGLYETKQNLRIEGLAEGEIQCEGTLTVAEGARVKAKVTASTITIAGELDGEVLCHGVFQIMPSGQVSASVSARRLIVQEGGLYNGDFRMIAAESNRAVLPDATWKGDHRDAPGNGASLDGLSNEDWWRKLTSAETPEQDTPEHEAPDAPDAPDAG
jgi:cytoskeletal protein CcmA (bactofilin family)